MIQLLVSNKLLLALRMAPTFVRIFVAPN